MLLGGGTMEDKHRPASKIISLAPHEDTPAETGWTAVKVMNSSALGVLSRVLGLQWRQFGTWTSTGLDHPMILTGSESP